MNEEQLKEMIATAVMWWTSYVTKVSAEGINGQDDHASAFVMYARLMAQKRNVPSEENVAKLMELLTEFLIQEEKSKSIGTITLSTDYAPEWPLSTICASAKISGLCFPQKTTMYIDFKEGTVTYSVVRGASGQIYPKE